MENNIEYNKFDGFVNHGRMTNIAINKVFGDFFSMLHQDKKVQKKYGITNVDLINHTLGTSINLTHFGVYRILLTFKGLRLMFKFDVYRNNSNEKIYELQVVSSERTKIRDAWVYNEIFKYSVESSEVKGKYIVLPPDELNWEITKITDRTFADIHLPNRIANELHLYKKVFDEQQFLMRNLLVGIPGTGKTESTIVLQNELNKLGVTIIKTTICDVFKDKVKLAEMLAPSIIVLDDIDLVLGSRNSGQISRNLKSFLDVLDGTEKISKSVGIIATTNSTSLLDVAAKRPGRFHKIILFDSLTKANVKSIIQKSLKMNFGVTENTDAFTNEESLKVYKEKGLTGSHIYNITELMYRKSQILKLDVDADWVNKEINAEIDSMERTQNFNGVIEETFKKKPAGGMGFNQNEELEEEEEVLYTERVEDVPCEEGCSPSGGGYRDRKYD